MGWPRAERSAIVRPRDRKESTDICGCFASFRIRFRIFSQRIAMYRNVSQCIAMYRNVSPVYTPLHPVELRATVRVASNRVRCVQYQIVTTPVSARAVSVSCK